MSRSGSASGTGTPPARPRVIIVGRPNVGKSALFNRMIGRRKAIVEDIPGTTRDRLQAEVEWRGRGIDLIDTGGLAEPTAVEGSGAYMEAIERQVEAALAEADLVLFVVDSKAGMTAADQEIAGLLRRRGVPVLLVANKAENRERLEAANEFFALGLGPPIAASALQGPGVGEVLDAVGERLAPPPAGTLGVVAPLRVAVIGRPNVGKSSLVNSLLGEERVIVSEVAGTTRDVIDTPFDYGGRHLLLLDTAGIRRPGKVAGSIERYSVLRAKEAVERADVAVAVFDASEGLVAQDLHIVGLALEAATGLVLCANKWDLAREAIDADAFVARCRRRLRFVPWAPIVLVSALQRLGLAALLSEVLAAGEARRQRVPTAELNAAVRRAIAERPPPMAGRVRLKLLYVTQAAIEPPTFVFFVNRAGLVPPNYRRYLEKALRRAFGFRGTSLRLVFRSRGEGKE
jgi:GTP-binding protein